MSTRKTTVFYAVLIAVASLAVGMVIASRLDLSPESSAQVVAVPAANTTPITGPVDAVTFRTIAKNVSPAVVNIRTESHQREQDLTEFFGGGDDLFRRFFGQPRGNGKSNRDTPTTVAAGTGFVIGKEGLILTNNHVVEGADKVEVSLYGEDDDVRYKARVIGRDPLTDSALIELTEKPDHPLPEVKFGDSSQMEPGDWVMAIGNPFNLSHTVSVGVISAMKRPFPVSTGRSLDMLQTDAAINPGNSGGPLLNIRGEVVGMNTAIYSDARQSGNIGIGFAVPINIVRSLLPQLRGGKITRGMIGVQVQPVPRDSYTDLGLKERRGALVATVTRGGPAQQAGMEPGDVIVDVNGKPVASRDELVQTIMALKPGTTVPLKVVRDKEERTLNVTIGELNLDRESESASNEAEPGDDDTSAGFGMTLGNLTAERARRLELPAGTTGAVIMEVDPAGAAARSGLAEGDVILRVNRQKVASAAEANRELQRVGSGGTAFMLIWRRNQEVFVPLKKD
jgi:serine protease Do